MTVRIAAITGLFVSAGLLAGCQNATPNFGQATAGGGMFGPHVASQTPQSGSDPFLNSQPSYDSAMNAGRVRVAGMQQPPQGYATSNPAPTMIPSGYQQPVMPAGYRHSVTPAGYQQPAGPFQPAATVPVGNAGWQSTQPPIQTIAR